MTKKKQNKPVVGAKSITKMEPFHTAGFWSENWWKALILIILPFILYYQSTQFGYVLDDQIVITDNQFTKKGFAGISEILTTESMTGYFGEQKELVQGNRYRPLSLVTFAIEYEVFNGLHPGKSHFINILLYALTALLLFRLLAMMFRKKPQNFWWLSIPFLTTIFFISHPIHSEAVANIKGRDEIMAMLFSLASLYSFLRYVDYKKTLWVVLSCVFFFLGLLSKENTITFLAVVPLTIYFFSDRSLWKSIKSIWPLLITTIIYLIIRFQTAGVPDFNQQITDLMNNPFYGMSGGEKLATIFFTLYKYIQLYIFPHPLSHDYYPYEIPVLTFADWRALASLILYGVIVYFGIKGFRKKKVYSYAILYYIATLSIVSNLVINVGTFMNERFIYMASLGLAILVAWLLSEKLPSWNKRTGSIISTIIAFVLIAGYSLKTIERVPDWESAFSLNQSAVIHGSNSARANSFMATALYNKGLEASAGEKRAIFEEAYQYAEKSVDIFPDYYNGSLMKVGVAAELHKLDRDEKVLLQRFAEVMAHRPDVSYISDYLAYLEERTNDMNYLMDWYAKTSIENVLKKANKPQWALHYLNRAYRLNKDHKGVLKATADVYARLGDEKRASTFYKLSEEAN